jgi:hypothetical protein
MLQKTMNNEIYNVSHDYSIKQINNRYSEIKDLPKDENDMTKGMNFNMENENIQMYLKASKIFLIQR